MVAINRFHTDSEEELAIVQEFCRERAVPCAVANVFGEGGDGAVALARTLLDALPSESRPLPLLYELKDSAEEKIRTIARRIYGADDIVLTEQAKAKLALFEKRNLGHLPICMAKTQNSLSDDATKRNRPRGFNITVRDFEISNGAGFLVALTGTMMRMPALPKVPAAERIQVSEAGEITGI